MRTAWLCATLLGIAPLALATTINTNDAGVYATFASGATVEDFESIAGMTALDLTSYANASNSSTSVPADAQLSGDIPGLHFHSGGASRNDLLNNPGTPAALLHLGGGIAGDARSASNVVGPIEINTDLLDLDQFIEIIFTGSFQNRVGFWLNPSLGNALLTAFDNAGNSIESIVGTAGNFVAIERPTNEIAFVSVVNAGGGFTIDDLTYGRAGTTSTVAEPGTAVLLAIAAGAMMLRRRRQR